MSAALTLGWLSPLLVGRVSDAVRGMLTDWTSTWGLPAAGPLDAEILAVAADVVPPSDVIDLFAPATDPWRDAIARSLFQLGAGESALVDAVVRRMTDQLQQTLQSQFPHGPSLGSSIGLPGHRGVRIICEVLGLRCRLEIGVVQLRDGGWLKPAPQPSLQAVNVEHAVSELPVPLVAELGRTQVSGNDLMQLAPGDVLLLEETLDAPLRVASPGCSFALSAHLGALADPPRRAARWLAA